MYVRVSLDLYLEDEYETVSEACRAYLDTIDDIGEDELAVEVFDEATQKWAAPPEGE